MTDWIWVASSRVGERTRADGTLEVPRAAGHCGHTLGLTHSRVDDLQNGNGEGGRLSRARLGLSNGVAALTDLHNGARLHGGRRLVAVRVDASQQVLLEVHGLEGGRHRDLLGGGELHLVIGIAIDSVGHGELRGAGQRC